MLNYRTHAENGSLYNTPPVFGIYILRLVLKWLVAQGGLAAIEKMNERKAGLLYAELDRTRILAARTRSKDSRSRMNITFRLPNEELDKLFVKESTAAGLRRPQGPSVGRRSARVDLQRVPRAGRRRPGRVHARVRTEARLSQHAHGSR